MSRSTQFSFLPLLFTLFYFFHTVLSENSLDAVSNVKKFESREEIHEHAINKDKLDPTQLRLPLTDATSDKIVVCYFTNWAMYRSGLAKFTPENINASLCTHINYAFASLDTESLTIVPSDSWADIDNKFFELVTALKELGLKVLIAIGGWNNSVPDHWSRMISNTTARALFVSSVLDFMQEYGFDGLDMDYEYPGCPQDNATAAYPNDIENFNLLMTELKQAFDGKYLLTIATAGKKNNIDDCYDMKPLCEVSDWVNVMTYDYYSYLDGEAGPNAPYRGSDSTFGVHETIHYYRDTVGCPAHKLVLGLPFYGKRYTLADPSEPHFGAPVTGAGDAGPYTATAGFLAYYEICEYIKEGYKVGHDRVNGSFAWNDTQFISYDSAASVVKKTALVTEHFNLRGAMFWTLDYDDFNNNCGCGSYPLLNNLNYHLGRTNTSISCY